MKLKTNNLLEELSNTEVNNLTIVVDETLAQNLKKEDHKNFTVAKLWDIQRRKKNLYSRKFYY
ncbi:MAG: hypothetical protein Q8891_07165 [Bacteroidota bacterium]|nr:hypothetical protein [Bacteroidota bacterium]